MRNAKFRPGPAVDALPRELKRLVRLAHEWAEFRRRRPRVVEMNEIFDKMSPEERDKMVAEVLGELEPDDEEQA